MIPNEHQQYLDQAIKVFSSDNRFVGLLGAGSLISKNVDQYSDIDLVAVCRDQDKDSVKDDRLVLLGQLGEMVSSFTGEHVGEPRVLICLFKNPLLHVDVKFITLSELHSRVENPVILFERAGAITKVYSQTEPLHPMPSPEWIEDRFWTWIHYGALRLGRGELFEVLDLLSFFRSTVFGPLILVQKGQLPRGVRRIEILAPEYSPALQRTVASYDRKSCVDALEASILLYRSLREEIGVSNRNSEAEGLAIDYFRQVAKKGE